MRIIFATDNYHRISGAGIFVDRIVSELKKRGHSILIIAPSRTHKYETYIKKGIKIFGLPSLPSLLHKYIRIAFPFFFKKSIRKLIKDFKPDIIHLQSPFPIVRTVLSIAEQLHIPTIGTNHFLPENLVHYLYIPKFTNKRFWKNYYNCLQRLDILTTPTMTAVNFLKSMGIKKEIYPISNGVDLRMFNPKNNGAYLKKRFAIPNRPVLLYLGRIDKEKKVDIILKALPLVIKNMNAHLVIAGKGTEMELLKNLAKSLNIKKFVTFTGYIPKKDLPNIYLIADCFVIASIAELQSIVTMEAMASGLPIIAAKAMAIPELVRHNKNGYLFNPNDIENLAKYIIKILSNKNIRKKFSKNSLKIIRKHDIKNTITQLESFYEILKYKNDLV